jgi:hypothetical protein
MAYNGDGQKLTGDDAFLQTIVFGAEILGDGATPLPVGKYLVIKVAAVSGFPAAAESGDTIAAGYVLIVDTGVTIIPETDDNVVTLTTTDKCDVTSWAMDFSKAEIDVTTLCDPIMKYRGGKPDMAGTMNGIFTAGISDDADGDLRQFITVVRQDGGDSYDIFTQEASIGLGFFYTNYITSIADQMFIIAPYELFGYSLGAEQGSAQSFASSFRFGNLSYTSDAGDTIAINPVFHRIGDGAGTT